MPETGTGPRPEIKPVSCAARRRLRLRLAAVVPWLLCVLPLAVWGQDHAHGSADAAAPYAGLQSRAVASLSEADLAELARGGGWGLALPAELGGWPGPAHVLELREELGLEPAQVAAITALHEAMRAEAVAAGERFVAAEAALDAAFADPDLDAQTLRRLVEAAGAARAELRFVHLSRHLATRPLLSDAQVARYAVLRGYAADPCAAVPEGHDPAMWRRHNGCE